MLLPLTIAFFLSMLTIVAGIAYWVWSLETAAAAAPGAPSPPVQPDEGADAGWLHLLTHIGSRIPAKDAENRAIRRELVSAGIRDAGVVKVLAGARVALGLGLAVILAVPIYSLDNDWTTVSVWILLGAYLGYRLPAFYLQRRLKRRQEAVYQGLPDLLDLLVISVDSGLSLDNAIADTARDLAIVHPVISDELGVFLAEIRAGANRADALQNLAQRTREPEMRKLTSLLVQADRFGTSLQKVLRTQARYLRIRRRQRAEELAHKVGVKMIFPIFFLIMPTMFLVTAGPAVLQLLSKFRGLADGL